MTKNDLQWFRNFELAEKFYKENGHLNISQREEVNGVKLGEWISRQRQKYKKNLLSKEQIKLLKDIGIIWNPLDIQWNNYFKEANKYFKKNGHLNISAKDEINGIKLGQWICNQRTNYKKGLLSSERVHLLEDIGMVWNASIDYNQIWLRNYELVKEFYKENGHLRISEKDIFEGVNLFFWINDQRKKYKKNLLSKEQIKLLEEIDMIWDASKMNGCSFPEFLIYHISKNIFGEDKILYRDKSFIGEELDICIPSLKCAIEYDGVAYHKNKNKQEKDFQKDLKCKESNIILYRIREDGLSNLENSVCYFVKPKLDYSILVLELKEFFKKYFSIETDIESFNIKEIYNEYALFKNNYLDNNWLNKFNLAKEFFEFNGHLNISKKEEVNGVKLGSWIQHQRQYYKKGKLSQKQINLLESIGMIWNSRDLEQIWLNNYKEAKKYFEENGHLNIPKKEEVNGVNLGFWISNQRSNYKKGLLSFEQIKLLEEIKMIWDVREVQWLENYDKAKEYFEKNGNLLVFDTYKTEDGFLLGKWIKNQRIDYKEKTNPFFTQERIELLEQIGMVWSIFEVQWNEKYVEAKKYFEGNGHLNISVKDEINGIKLGRWIDTQRKNKKNNKLSQKRIDLLESIGMVWNTRAKAA